MSGVPRVDNSQLGGGLLNEESTSVLVRMPAHLKAALQREAFAFRRSLTAEIVLRLEASLQSVNGSRPNPSYVTSLTANEPTPDNSYELSATEHAMLDVFKRLPPEKQLALLSLLKK